MPQRFRTKPVEIEATQFTGTNLDELISWTEGNFKEIDVMGLAGPIDTFEGEAIAPVRFEKQAQVYDKLHTTWINVLPGQWIVRGAKGEYYPCDDETFHWKYEEVK